VNTEGEQVIDQLFNTKSEAEDWLADRQSDLLG